MTTDSAGADEHSARAAREVAQAIDHISIDLRLFGGAAIALEGFWDLAFGVRREIRDIDLICRREHLVRALRLLEEMGVQFDAFSLLKSDRRLARGKLRGIGVDLYSDPLYVNQRIAFGDRLALRGPFLSAADLLATKLQIEAPKRSDVCDIIAIVTATETARKDAPGSLNVERIADLCFDSWRFYHAAVNALSRAMSLLAHDALVKPGLVAIARERGSAISAAFEARKKPFPWRVRAKIGQRWRYFDEV